jgi:hypothetical protein
MIIRKLKASLSSGAISEPKIMINVIEAQKLKTMACKSYWYNLSAINIHLNLDSMHEIESASKLETDSKEIIE